MDSLYKYWKSLVCFIASKFLYFIYILVEIKMDLEMAPKEEGIKLQTHC